MRKALFLLLFFLCAAACLHVIAPRQSVIYGNTQKKSSSVELQVMSQTRFLAGSPASIRIVAFNPSDMKGVAGIPVQVMLEQGKSAVHLFSGYSDSTGTVSPSFRIPASLKGSGNIKVTALDQDVTIPVAVVEENKIYLTTDKPLYQPSQIMQLRALCLSVPGLKPASGKTLTFEVEDSKGNKVFKKRVSTSRFGIASAKFELADEVNLGEYHVRAMVGEAEAERSVNVKKYVLPKFKVTLDTEKNFYLPGEKVNGSVQARYFFGKPVAGGGVRIDFSTFDVALHKIGEIQGKTNQEGVFNFEFILPKYFVGQPLQKGNAMLEADAKVADLTGHEEKATRSYPVSSSSIVLEALPERETLVSGIPNVIYLVAGYPDGTPAKCRIRITTGSGEKTNSSRVETDALGIAKIQIVPHQQGASLQIEASDKKGNKGSFQTSFSVGYKQDYLVLRTSRGVYKSGEDLMASIISSKPAGTIYLDFLSNGETILTKSVELSNGKSAVSIPLSADLAGVVEIQAYQLLAQGEMIRDSRKVIVQPSKQLNIGIFIDKKSYRPGEQAKLRFVVRDKNGKPVLSALGVDVVDESLFALAEKQPGLEQVYFLLEKELAEPKYEIHGVGLPDLFLKPSGKEEVAVPLLSKVPENPNPYSFRYNSYTNKLSETYNAINRVYNAAYRYYAKFHRSPGSLATLIRCNFLKDREARDPWGSLLVIEPYSKFSGSWKIYSIGPDKTAGTADDLDSSKIASLNHLYNEDRMELAGGQPIFEEMKRREAVKAMINTARDLPAPPASVDKKQPGSARETRVREFFPETLFSQPELITDERGLATLTVPLADSITTWRISSTASSMNGEMGGQTAALRVFQDFFIDLDLPVSLTQGDIISIPVSIYNYVPHQQTIAVTLKNEAWFNVMGPEKKIIKLGKNEVSSVSFTVQARKIGTFPLTVYARGAQMSDAIKRNIEVVPNGQEKLTSASDKLNKKQEIFLAIPKEAIPDASKILVTVYPGLLSQVMEGLDKIFAMPNGCFEQTSSTTYPNVLVLDYLKKTRKITPEIQMKAESYINTGYQRLLTFEVNNSPGAFSVFGQPPGNEILTSYGLMEFSDMAKIYEVDPSLILRTSRWLVSRQGKDGSWSAGSQGFYAEGWSNIPNSSLPSTAYATWALEQANSSQKAGPEVRQSIDSGIRYIKEHINQARDPYTLSLCANALAAYDPKGKETQDTLEKLALMASVQGEKAFWHSAISTATYGTGTAADVETTALACLALLHGDYHFTLASKAMNFLVSSKDPQGTWHSTQATVLTMKAMIASLEKESEKMAGKGEISLDGKKCYNFSITPENYDLFTQFDLGVVGSGKHQISVTLDGKATAYYKVTGKYYIPWQKTAAKSNPLSIDLTYNRTALHLNDRVTAFARITNNMTKTANMILIDLGIPPGFEVETDNLEALVSKRIIEKFSLTGRQIIVYVEKINPGESLKFSYVLKARYPVQAKTPPSTVYEYYNPNVRDVKEPIKMTVTQ